MGETSMAPGDSAPRQAYVLMFCGSNGQRMIARFAEQAGSWNLTAAHASGATGPPGDRSAASALSGQFGLAADYPGCPECGHPSYVRCHVCRELSCWSGAGIFRCVSCGTSGPVSGGIRDVRVDDYG